MPESTAFTFTVERIGTTDGDVDFTVSLSLRRNGRCRGLQRQSRYFRSRSTARSSPVRQSATVTVNVNGDTDVEVNEDFTLTITNVTNATAPAAIDTNQDEADGRILTDDFAGTDIGGVAVLAEAASLQGATAVPRRDQRHRARAAGLVCGGGRQCRGRVVRPDHGPALHPQCDRQQDRDRADRGRRER